MATFFLARLRKDPDSDYGVDFPDFPGCVTAGSTVEEAFAMAREALDGHVSCMVDAGLALPAPTSFEDVVADPDSAGALLLPVPVEEPSKPVRVNIMIQSRDLTAIDAYAKSHGMSRSGFLVTAARQAMAEA